jgi:uncharacterized protein (DUF849 family)
LAAGATAAVAAGAEAVHLHPRSAGGSESLLAADVGAAVAAVRLACPGVPVGVSTGLWISGGDVAARLAMVGGWAGLPAAARPEFASVNLAEPGFADLAGMLRSAGVGVEAGVWSPADAEALAAAGDPDSWLRILIEVIDAPAGGAVDAAEAILRRLDDLGTTAPRLLHGEGAACWPLIAHAGRLGLPTRIGLEDTITGPTAEPADDNAELVRLALATWTAARR